MPETTQRKVRNSRLSAYYGLQKEEENVPLTIPKDSEEALSQITQLTRTLSLNSLLRHTTSLQKTSETLQASLHTSVRNYYQNLSTTSKVAKEASEHAGSLASTIPTLTNLITQTTQINANLAPTRLSIDNLEAARRAILLQTAAENLAATLSPRFTELNTLCTDPTPLRNALFLSARRTAIILPAITTLSTHAPQFLPAATALRSAADDLLAQLSLPDIQDPYTLPLEDRLQLRRLLDDDPAILRDAFHIASAATLSKTPSQAAYSAVSPPARASLLLSFAIDKLIPLVYKVASQYADIFQPDADWPAFVVWLSDVLDDAIAAQVRRFWREDPLAGPVLREHAPPFLDAIIRLLATSDSVAEKVKLNGHTDGAESAKQVISAMCEQLRGGLVASVSRETNAAWRGVVDAVLSGERDMEAVEELFSAVREVSGREEWLTGLAEDVSCDEESLLRMVARYSIEKCGSQGDLTRQGRIGVLCRELGVRARDRATGGVLHAASERVFDRVARYVVDSVLDLLCERLGSDCSSGEFCKVIELLRQADGVGRECGVQSLLCRPAESVGMHVGDALLLGGEDSVVSAVLRGWVEVVRAGYLAGEKDLHELQIDAIEVGEGIGRTGFFDNVAKAGLDRCGDSKACLLDSSEVKLGLEKRFASRM